MPESSEQKRRHYRAGGYWAAQIGAAALMTIICFGAGGILLFASPEFLSRSGEEPERGGGVMLMLIGIGMLVLLINLIRSFASMNGEQRAVYAWAVMQQHASRTDGHPANPGAVVNDLKILSIARRARRGELSADEIAALQQLRPDVPYPGTMPGKG